jgi:hypothetical protein
MSKWRAAVPALRALRARERAIMAAFPRMCKTPFTRCSSHGATENSIETRQKRLTAARATRAARATQAGVDRVRLRFRMQLAVLLIVASAPNSPSVNVAKPRVSTRWPARLRRSLPMH